MSARRVVVALVAALATLLVATPADAAIAPAIKAARAMHCKQISATYGAGGHGPNASCRINGRDFIVVAYRTKTQQRRAVKRFRNDIGAGNYFAAARRIVVLPDSHDYALRSARIAARRLDGRVVEGR